MNAPHHSQKEDAQPLPHVLRLEDVRPRERRRLQAYLAFVIVDITTIILSFAMAGWAYQGVIFEPRTMLAAQLLLPLFLTIAFYNGTYSLETLKEPQATLLRLLAALLISAALLNFFAFYAKSNAVFSRVSFTLGLALSGVMMGMVRIAAKKWLRRFIGPVPQNILLIDDGGPLIRMPHAYHLVASQHDISASLNDPHGLDRLSRVMRHMDRVIVSCAAERRLDWALILKGSGVQGELHSDFVHEIGALGVRHHPGAGFSSLVVSTGPLGIRARLTKRAFDIGVSALVLFVLSPLLILVGLAVKLADGGPVLFVQPRLGRANRLFSVYKFRTMHAAQQDAAGENSTQRDDDRVTRIGRFLRRTSIDELPQLFNVLQGDMSLVGPRPHALGSQAGAKLFWEIDPRYWQRHALKPGVTGLAQVRGWRGATQEEEDLTGRLQADLEYLSSWSIWRDIAILFATLKVLNHKNAF